MLDAVERLEQRWPQLAAVEFAVEQVPPPGAEFWSADPVPLGRAIRAARGEPDRIVVYRRPTEVRAATQAELVPLVYEVVVEQVAELLGLDPEIIDPETATRSDGPAAEAERTSGRLTASSAVRSDRLIDCPSVGCRRPAPLVLRHEPRGVLPDGRHGDRLGGRGQRLDAQVASRGVDPRGVDVLRPGLRGDHEREVAARALGSASASFTVGRRAPRPWPRRARAVA